MASEDSSQSSANRVLRINNTASRKAGDDDPSSNNTSLDSGSHSIGPLLAPLPPRRPRGDRRPRIMFDGWPSSSSPGTCNSFNAIRRRDFHGLSNILHSGVLATMRWRVAGGRFSFIPDFRQAARLFSCSITHPSGVSP